MCVEDEDAAAESLEVRAGDVSPRRARRQKVQFFFREIMVELVEGSAKRALADYYRVDHRAEGVKQQLLQEANPCHHQ